MSEGSWVLGANASSLELIMGAPRLWERSPRTTPERVAAGRTSEGETGLNWNSGGARSHTSPQDGVSQGLPAGGAPGAWGPRHLTHSMVADASAAPRLSSCRAPGAASLPAPSPALPAHPSPSPAGLGLAPTSLHPGARLGSQFLVVLGVKLRPRTLRPPACPPGPPLPAGGSGPRSVLRGPPSPSH